MYIAIVTTTLTIVLFFATLGFGAMYIPMITATVCLAISAFGCLKIMFSKSPDSKKEQ